MKIAHRSLTRLTAILVTALLLCSERSAQCGFENSDAIQILPTGLLYPAFSHAHAMNPAALPFENGKALGLDYSPSAFGAAQSIFGVGVDYGSGSWGAGLGYLGSQPSSGGDMTHQAAFGVAGRFSEFAFGVSMIGNFLTANFNPSLNASIEAGASSGLQFAAILYNINGQLNKMAMGLGHREEKKYTLEGGLQLPFMTRLFSPGTSNTYSAYLGAAVFFGEVGACLNANYGLGTDTLTVGGGLLWSVNRQVRLSLLWNDSSSNADAPILSPTGLATFELTLVL